MIIRLNEKFTPYCINKEHARNLNILLSTTLKRKKETATIDFSRIRVLSSDFMFESIGKLTKSFTPDVIGNRIQFVNTTKNQKDLIMFTLEFYNRYYRDDEYKHIIDDHFGIIDDIKKEKSGGSKGTKNRPTIPI